MMVCCVLALPIILLSVIVVDGLILSQQQNQVSIPSIALDGDRKARCSAHSSCQTTGHKNSNFNGCSQNERNSRRDFLYAVVTISAVIVPLHPEYASAVDSSSGSLESIFSEIQKARQQMNAVPDLMKSEQWDGVRAILITPPLSDLWTKSARKSSLLQDYANAIGATPTGDELAVLEAKEDVEGHLRFLDMAVYNNNFNPINSVGEIGATKALISSYYDDPINEFEATVAALDNLIQLGNVRQ